MRLSLPYYWFPNDKEFRASEEYGYDDIGDKIRHTLNQSLWTHSLDLYVGEADNYLRPFDIMENIGKNPKYFSC